MTEDIATRHAFGKTAMSEKSFDIVSGPETELPGMTLSGSFLENLDFVEESSMSLLVSLGELDETQAKILVPFISLKVHGSKLHEEEPSASIFEATLSLEDTAYLLSSLSEELAVAVSELAALNKGPVKLEPYRLNLAKEFISDASVAIGHCRAIIEGLEAVENATEHDS